MSEYAARDKKQLCHHYTRHVQAITDEGLREKADIAAELAYRDRRIEALEAALNEALSYPQVGGAYQPWMATAEAVLMRPNGCR